MHRLWIKSWRRKLDSDIWKMPPMYMRVFEWILHSVNHEERTIPTPTGPILLHPGQRITSLRQIADGVSYYEYGVQRIPNVKTIKAILEWLEGNGKCTVESNGKGTIITVMNWHAYNRKDEEKVTDMEQEKVTASKQTLDTNKNKKNEKNNNKGIFLIPSLEEVKAYCQERNRGVNPQKWYDFYQGKGWMVGKNKMKDWRAAVRTWEKDELELPIQPVPEISDAHKRTLERLKAEGYE